MKKLISTHIDLIHYDPNTKILEITFNQGKKYHYHNVEQHSYDALEKAESHGKHFDKHIKGKYTTKKI